MSLGSWNVNVITGGMPEKVATAVSALSETLIGAEYTPIAYLGSQVVNGVNHAVLAEQLLITGKDTKNIVLLIFNEKGMNCDLVNIERVLEGSLGDGGIKIHATTDIPEEALEEFNTVIAGFVGSKVEPFAYLGSQVVKGINTILAAELTPVVENPEKTVAVVVVNSLTNTLKIVNILGSKVDVASLGYAFTWLS